MAKQTGLYIWDIFLTLWIVAGFVYIGVLEIERGLKNTADEAQEKLHHIVIAMLVYVGGLIIFGIPFIFVAAKRNYMPVSIKWMDAKTSSRLRYH